MGGIHAILIILTLAAGEYNYQFIFTRKYGITGLTTKELDFRDDCTELTLFFS